MMRFTRRQFLQLSAVAGLAALGGTLFFRSGYPYVRERALGLVPSEVVALTEKDILTLLLLTESLVGAEIERGHYEQLFRWRALNLAGYGALYVNMCGRLDQVSQRRVGHPFHDADTEQRHAAVAALRAIKPSAVGTAWLAIVDRDRLLFERYIIQPILEQFGRTDALVRLGYDGWPGRPRGLEAYRMDPRNAKGRA